MEQEILNRVNGKLQRRLMTGQMLLNRFRLLDETSRQSSAYTDPIYVPFYFYLGEELKPLSLVEMGFRLGLCSGNFLRSCKSVEYFLAFQEKTDEYYSPRLAIHNVRDYYKKGIEVHVGKVLDHEFTNKLGSRKWDLAIVNEEKNYDTHLSYLELLWDHMNYDGSIVMDFVGYHEPARRAYFDFCKRKNREPQVIKTRYGVGVMTK